MESKIDRSYAKDILPKRLEKFIEEFEEDMKVTEVNIHDKTLLKPSIAAKWARYNFEEERYKKKLLASIEDLKKKISDQLFEKKKNSIMNQTASSAMLNIEADKLLKKTSQYQEIKTQIDEQDELIRFIVEARQIVSQFGFDLKNSIDVLKLENI